MKPSVRILNTHLDDRGRLTEYLRADDPEFVKFGQVYLSTTTPGTIKAFHRHFHKTDHITCTVGQVKLVVIDGDLDGTLRNLYEYHLSPLAPKLITIPPGLWHGWQSVSTEEAYLISITTDIYDPKNVDEERAPALDNPWNYKWGVKHG